MASPAWADVAGSAYRGLIDDQLKREDARKTSFESRGMQIIASSGTFVTLVFALAAVVTGTSKFKLADSSKGVLALSLVLFAAAAAYGILTNMPGGDYVEAEASSLKRLLDEQFWLGPVEIAQRRVAELEVALISAAREENNRKADLLRLGLGCEVFGVLAVAAAVLLILT